MLPRTIRHEFVEFIPDELEQNTIYISIPYAAVMHLCLCGCGNKSITPLEPSRRHLEFDGATISLTPSVGNWSFPCQSHYWITNGRVRASARWSREKIEAGRARDQALTASHERANQEAETGTPGRLARVARRLRRRRGTR